jgi:uridine kinase
MRSEFQKWALEYKDNPLREDAYNRADRVAKLLSWVTPVMDDSLVPTDSVVREFIGGSSLQY